MKVAILLLAVVGALASPSSKIESKLLTSLKVADSANIFVSFEAGTSTALNSISTRSFATRGDRITAVNLALRANAKSTQAAILSFLEQSHVAEVRSFWISNQIYIKNASQKLVNALAAFPAVSKITEEGFATIDMPANSVPFETAAEELTWGLTRIQVEDVWNLENGNQGEGVIVGGIDTGVRYTHEALADNYLGDYGWFDPSGKSATPNDNNGHGTHTMGTIAGSKGVGVAPKAKWIACKGCASNSCAFEDLLACGEFMQCPTLADGSKPDCSKAPKVVSNSWGGPGGDPFYKTIIEAWVASEIVPVFANGNRYPWNPICGGASSPGDHPLAIAVGNTDINEALATSSCRGPAKSGDIKPEVSAPGTDVKSAWITSDTSYNSITGTSMACPHVAGVVALLASHKPNVTVEDVRKHLTSGNEQDGLTRPGNNCGGIDENTFPNNAFGHGRISALNSYKSLLGLL